MGMDDFEDVFNKRGELCGYIRLRQIGGYIARGKYSVVLHEREDAIAWVKAHPLDLETELKTIKA
jgi:hypothetical protein